MTEFDYCIYDHSGWLYYHTFFFFLIFSQPKTGHKIRAYDLPCPGNYWLVLRIQFLNGVKESHVVLLVGSLLLAVDVYGENGVAPGTVLIHIVRTNSSVFQTLLQNIRQNIAIKFIANMQKYWPQELPPNHPARHTRCWRDCPPRRPGTSCSTSRWGWTSWHRDWGDLSPGQQQY